MEPKSWPTPTDPQRNARRWRATSDGLYREIEPGLWWRTDGIDLVPEEEVDRHCEMARCGIVVMQDGTDLTH